MFIIWAQRQTRLISSWDVVLRSVTLASDCPPDVDSYSYPHVWHTYNIEIILNICVVIMK